MLAQAISVMFASNYTQKISLVSIILLTKIYCIFIQLFFVLGVSFDCGNNLNPSV